MIYRNIALDDYKLFKIEKADWWGDEKLDSN
jgi:hypothetical protein